MWLRISEVRPGQHHDVDHAYLVGSRAGSATSAPERPKTDAWPRANFLCSLASNMSLSGFASKCIQAHFKWLCMSGAPKNQRRLIPPTLFQCSALGRNEYDSFVGARLEAPVSTSLASCSIPLACAKCHVWAEQITPSVWRKELLLTLSQNKELQVSLVYPWFPS